MNFHKRAHQNAHWKAHGGIFDDLWEGFDDFFTMDGFGDGSGGFFQEINFGDHFHHSPASMYQQEYNQGGLIISTL